ncbi:MAG: hypothetical protein AB7E47_13010 [Desulfovibrionaceae bacterium]
MKKLCLAVFVLFFIVGCGKKELADCKQDVISFEKEFLSVDAKFQKGYARFRNILKDTLSGTTDATQWLQIAQDAKRTAETAHAVAYRLHISSSVPDDLYETLENVRKNISVSYFAQMKMADNVIFILTHSGEMYSTQASLATEAQNYMFRAVIGLTQAKQMVGMLEKNG